LPSRRSAFVWLLDKEWRELVASRSWWVLLGVIGPLVGVSFISAVRTYGELSSSPAGVGEAFSPLVGIWAPTFSACELAAIFLLPFVAIRLVAGDRQSGALKIELQHRTSSLVRVAAKALVLLSGWLVASIPVIIAVLLWAGYGGHVHVPEVLTVGVGHLLNAGLTIAIAAATASFTDHPSTAAIVTLSVTVGTWIVNFLAAVQGGIWERAAAYTPPAMVAELQHGLIRSSVVLIALTLIAGGLVLSAIWMRLGVPVRRRLYESFALGLCVAAAVVVSAFLSPSWDTSEERRNSLPRGDEAALSTIHGSLHIEAHLAPEDPRRSDLEHRVLTKLRRIMPVLEVDYISASSTGLFEQSDAQYGEIWYDLDGRRVMNRSTTSEGVLETIYTLAGVSVPAASDDDVFRGHPLAARPTGAAWIFYAIWPTTVFLLAFLQRRRS
jgi:ABC-2 type transport system permease protein